MPMEADKTMTSKERFDQVMSEVKSQKSASDEISEEEVDEVENFMQENPEIAHPNGHANAANLRNLQESTLGNLQRLNQAKRKSHVSQEDLNLLREAFKKFETKKLNHPILEHLFQTKLKLSNEYTACQQKAKVLYQEMLKQMSDSSEQNLKIIGAIENVDKQIIELLKSEGDSNLPPSA